jgi:hypothetical protein
LICLTNIVSAGSGSSADFDNFKHLLEGKWSFREDNQTYETTFELVSKGTAVLERNPGFTVLYYPDGAALMMTLFTEEGHQIRMRAAPADRKSSSIEFTFQDATNVAAGGDHMNGLTLLFKDETHIVERWKMIDGKGATSSFDFALTRTHAPR